MEKHRQITCKDGTIFTFDGGHEHLVIIKNHNAQVTVTASDMVQFIRELFKDMDFFESFSREWILGGDVSPEMEIPQATCQTLR